jgi:hypothetical protein
LNRGFQHHLDRSVIGEPDQPLAESPEDIEVAVFVRPFLCRLNYIESASEQVVD